MTSSVCSSRSVRESAAAQGAESGSGRTEPSLGHIDHELWRGRGRVSNSLITEKICSGKLRGSTAMRVVKVRNDAAQASDGPRSCRRRRVSAFRVDRWPSEAPKRAPKRPSPPVHSQRGAGEAMTPSMAQLRALLFVYPSHFPPPQHSPCHSCSRPSNPA